VPSLPKNTAAGHTFCQEQTAEGGVFVSILMMSDYYDQSIVWQVVADGMGEADGLTIIDGRGINASTLELIQ